jgi:hypothetical protein
MVDSLRVIDPSARYARASDTRTRFRFLIFLSARNREVAFKVLLRRRALIAVDAISAPIVRACDACSMSRVNWMSLSAREIYCCAKQYTFLEGK